MISEVYNVDCLEYMRTVPDNFFSLAIVDPPYGIKRSCIGKRGGNIISRRIGMNDRLIKSILTNCSVSQKTK